MYNTVKKYIYILGAADGHAEIVPLGVLHTLCTSTRQEYEYI